MKPKNPLALVTSWIALALISGPAAQAADGSAAGMIEGRAMNSRNGEYLENARVTVEGTALEAFTDSRGHYRLGNVPAGTVKVRVFFTGLDPLTETVAVVPGELVKRDFNLPPLPSGSIASPEGVVRLSQFVVGASREMDGSAIAINEQRFAPNIKNVVSTDEFGIVAEGNVAEFMKFLPGIAIEYSGGEAWEMSINGVPPDNVPINVGGFSLAGTSGSTGRGAKIGMIALNNVSRIEVSFSPTPDTQGSALAGVVDMLPRSAFERSRPAFNFTTSIAMRDNARDFKKTPGPRARATRKVHPGFDFSYVMPVNDRFGFTLSGGAVVQYTNEPRSQNTWRGVGTATNGAAFPDTTPDKPYLSTYALRDTTTESRRSSFSATFDYRISRHDQISFSFQSSTYLRSWMVRTITFNVNRVLPADFSSTFTHGAAAQGNLQVANSGRDRYNPVYTPSVVWRHDGPIWKSAVGAGFSRMDNRYTDINKGIFMGVTAMRTGVTVSFDDNTYLRPRVITVTDGTTGAPVDPYKLSNYALTSATSQQDNSSDLQRTAYANLRRTFDWRTPLTVKGGFDLRQIARDLHSASIPYTYVGPDGRASTTPIGSDDSAAPFLDASISQRIAPYGFSRIEWASNEQVLDFYRSNPTYFTRNPNTDYRNNVTGSKRAEEIVSAAYIRGDLQFFDRRLKLVGGVRGEQTNVKAWGPLTDPARNVRRDARGAPILGANGLPLPITTDALESSKLTFIERGARTEKEYLRLFPSLNASFAVRENLIARAAYYYSVGRPDFNQYAGGLTLPDVERGPSTSNRITVNNAGIKAWSARTASVRLEYYFEGIGQLSIGGFRRAFENQFGSTVFAPTPEFLGLYGLDPAVYGNYDVATQHNLPGVIRMEGLEFSYKQALTFLPRWSRGLQVFVNGNTLRATGANVNSLTGANYVPRSGSWGISLTRETYNARVNWNYRGRQLKGPVAAGRGIEPDTKTWGTARLYVDASGEYYLSRKIAVYLAVRNLTDAIENTEILNRRTPANARLQFRENFGALWTLGIKGTF
ncbi:MAG: carboxypeptidase regulatory-like domain-containing protein [Verrucomicrobia bacterium]|nr:carboxypeptidase regulatory-like domain-containing protein [Verrucomicrobiota bacterium]